MIVVKVELWSARTGEKTELGRMMLANLGGKLGNRLADYGVKVLRKGDQSESWDTRVEPTRVGTVRNHPRLSLSIWRLILSALKETFPEGV